MTLAPDIPAPTPRLLERRQVLSGGLAEQTARFARAARIMAGRFSHGGTAWTFGTGPGAEVARAVSTDFTRPPVAGRRPLPSMALEPETGPVARQLGSLANPGDLVIVLLALPTTVDRTSALDTLATARALRLPVVALTCPAARPIVEGVDHVIASPASGPLLTTEFFVTAHHLLTRLTYLALSDLDGIPHEHSRSADRS